VTCRSSRSPSWRAATASGAGDDDRAVEPDRVRKSLSNERTYGENLTTLQACREALEELVRELQEELRLKANDRIVRKAVVKVKFADFTRTTRECVSANPDMETYQTLLAEAWTRRNQPVRLLGAGVRFADEEEDVTEDNLQQELAFESASS
jgi:DNA polymerase-4